MPLGCETKDEVSRSGLEGGEHGVREVFDTTRASQVIT